jgi:uncharacterized protein Yka (UPF0111/DUF47 family)
LTIQNSPIKVTTTKLNYCAIIVLKDVIDMFEEISDKAEDACDSARILALSAL